MPGCGGGTKHSHNKSGGKKTTNSGTKKPAYGKGNGKKK